MSHRRLKVDSVRGVLAYVGAGALLGGVFQGVLVVTTRADLALARVVLPVFLGAGLVFWWLSLKQLRRRQRLTSPFRRSPWGERRQQAPRPYAERLSVYLSGEVSGREVAPAPRPFESVVDYRGRDPVAPKPVWWIRQVLERVHSAVRGPAG